MNTNTHELRPMFLFGSRTSAMPNVEDVTEAVLNGDYHFHTDGRLYPGEISLKEKSIKAFLKFIYQKYDASNYEDLAYIISVLWKQDGTGRDPTVTSFHQEIIQAIGDRPELQLPKELGIQPTRSKIFDSARSWISWVVHQQLQNQQAIPPTDLINFFTALNLKENNSWICTLNHDLETEAALKQLHIEFNSGFIRTAAKHPRFSANQMFQPLDNSTLLKLHGSINWFSNNSEYYEVPVPLSMDDEDYINGTPAFLSGSLNKLEDYTYQIYPWIWAAFQNQLLRTKRIICSGYGFMDLGVTSRLSGWLSAIEDTKLLILDPDPVSLVQRCQKHAISNIGGFFGYPESSPKYNICEDSSGIETAEHSIILLKCRFEEASQHAEALRKFAYDSI
jgi:hypothetical protein